jgi:NAD(P)-dependent dehydrogenase (short-subunit alcohol dehydrogenase family)
VTIHPGHWDYQIQISISAILHACRAAVPHMAKNPEGGAIINMSSVHGLLAARKSVAYETVKTAIIGMTRQMQGSVALWLCTAAHPLHTRFINIFGTFVSEATMRLDPRQMATDFGEHKIRVNAVCLLLDANVILTPPCIFH